MRKLFITAAVLALTPTAAGAETFYVTISLERYKLVTEAAKSVCREAMNTSGPASVVLERAKGRLGLNPDEHLFLTTLCVLYASGRVDG